MPDYWIITHFILSLWETHHFLCDLNSRFRNWPDLAEGWLTVVLYHWEWAAGLTFIYINLCLNEPKPLGHIEEPFTALCSSSSVSWTAFTLLFHYHRSCLLVCVCLSGSLSNTHKHPTLPLCCCLSVAACLFPLLFCPPLERDRKVFTDSYVHCSDRPSPCQSGIWIFFNASGMRWQQLIVEPEFSGWLIWTMIMPLIDNQEMQGLDPKITHLFTQSLQCKHSSHHWHIKQ